MRERDIEAHLVKRGKELGGEIRKVKWIGRRGAPDRVLLMDADQWAANVLGTTDFAGMSFTERAAFARRMLAKYIVWPELKAPGKLATFPADAHERQQHREHNRMRKMGQRVVVIDSIEGIEELLS